MMGRERIYTEFWWGNLLEKNYLEDGEGDETMHLMNIG
jgi:hypothetical protein